MKKTTLTLADRMKEYELAEAGRVSLRGLPVVARVDGRAFHTLTRKLKAQQPFDDKFISLMDDTCKFLVEETHAVVGYVQSDEITLLLSDDSFFNGRFQKLTSVIASLAAAKFNRLLVERYTDIPLGNVFPSFDTRVWVVPTKEEAVNAVLWREYDASKNSVAMLAQSLFSHKDLQNKNGNEMQGMCLRQHNVNWNDLPDRHKRGAYYRRRTVERALTPTEKAVIEAKTKKPAAELVTRSEIQRMVLPPLGRVLNRVDVIYDDATPVMTDPTLAPGEVRAISEPVLIFRE